MKIKGIFLTAILAVVLCISSTVLAVCPSRDLTGDCFVDLEDFSLLAAQWLEDFDSDDLAAMALEWLTEGIPGPDMIWVSINDPGVSGHEGFKGHMCKYETTNAQYCQFLNAAIESGDITVGADNIVDGASGLNPGADFVGMSYYNLAGPGHTATYNGATNAGAARINWTGSLFTVDSGFENHPVTYVSWYGATAFAGYYGWRLPTEWEWRAVADYDGTFTYGCGTSINNSKANYLNSVHPHGTTAVGTFGTYGYGMCDMAGNVYEWTASCYYADCAYGWRVLRDGTFFSAGSDCTIVRRANSAPGNMGNSMGFRVCY